MDNWSLDIFNSCVRSLTLASNLLLHSSSFFLAIANSTFLFFSIWAKFLIVMNIDKNTNPIDKTVVKTY